MTPRKCTSTIFNEDAIILQGLSPIQWFHTTMCAKHEKQFPPWFIYVIIYAHIYT